MANIHDMYYEVFDCLQEEAEELAENFLSGEFNPNSSMIVSLRERLRSVERSEKDAHDVAEAAWRVVWDAGDIGSLKHCSEDFADEFSNNWDAEHAEDEED